MFETDFPHETSLQANGRRGCDVAEENLSELDPAVTRKVLYENAARVYGLDNESKWRACSNRDPRVLQSERKPEDTFGIAVGHSISQLRRE